MQTPALLNTSSVTPGNKPAAKPAENAASDSAFTQMLSRQMDERRSASNAEQARAANKADEAGKIKEKSSADKAAGAAAPGKSAAPAKTDDGSASVEAAGAPVDREAQATAGEAGATPPTATELLALAVPDQVKTQADAVLTNTATAAQAAAAIGKNRLASAAEEGIVGAEKDGADGTDFKATLEQSRQAAKGLPDAINAASSKAQEKAAEMPATAKLQDGLPVSGAVPQLQQAGFDITQAATGRVTDRLTPHVGTPAWDQAVGQKVVWMVAGSQQSASLTLNPPDLGPLQVVLNVSNGQADASFYAAQPEVRQALEAALPKLREMMSEAGVTLGQTSVSAGMPDQHNQPGGQSARQASHGQGATHNAASAPLARSVGPSSGQGLVDTFA